MSDISVTQTASSKIFSTTYHSWEQQSSWLHQRNPALTILALGSSHDPFPLRIPCRLYSPLFDWRTMCNASVQAPSSSSKRRNRRCRLIALTPMTTKRKVTFTPIVFIRPALDGDSGPAQPSRTSWHSRSSPDCVMSLRPRLAWPYSRCDSQLCGKILPIEA